MSDYMDPELERRILACPTLPSLPAVALELLRLCRDDEIDLRRVAEALSRDPALAARVLRAANSASLAARGKVSTLTRAVPLLGTNATLTLALSFSLVRGRRRDDRAGFDHRAFWRRSVFSALAGRVLAESGIRSADPEEAFLAALLQDLGMLALAEVFPREYGILCASAGSDHAALAAGERREWGCDHAAVGGLLARTWSLPACFGDAMAASHERPGSEGTSRQAKLDECVHSSGWIADIWTTGEWHAVATARAAMGPDGPLLERLIERMALAVPEAAADFDIDLGGPERLESVLAQARRLRHELGVHDGDGAIHDGNGAAGSDALPARVGAAASFDSAIDVVLDHARARGAPVSLVALRSSTGDGQAAQAALRFVARTVRPTDLLGLAGDDVLLLLPDTPLAGARAVATRLLANAPAALPSGPPLAIGIAAATGGAGATPAALRGAALAALAAAHRSGGGVATADPGGAVKC
jgi:HD-like signal output (HDOD) protein